MVSIDTRKVDDAQMCVAAVDILSPFQWRIGANGLDKGTLSAIASTPHDVLLIDFIDERFNLFSMGDSFLIHSGELRSVVAEPSEHAVIGPRSEEFLAQWIAGFE